MITRRSLGAAALSAAAVGHTSAASDRIRLGVIGTGNRGQFVTRVFAANPDVQVAAVCDVYQPNLEAGSKVAGGTVETYRDYRRLLDRKDIDAVLIASPDHWHGAMTADACAAGKDVYVEKPASNTIEGAARLVSAEARYKRVVQVGIQQRSWPHFLEAARLVASGQLGVLEHVVCMYPGGSRRRSEQPSPPPENLDWEMFQGPAPRKPYVTSRQLAWRGYYDYGGGLITDWGVHLTDTAHMLTRDDQPRSVSAVFQPVDAGSSELAPNTFSIVWSYDTCLMTFTNVMPYVTEIPGWGVYVYGSEGMMLVNRNGYLTRPTRPLGRAGQNWKPKFEPATEKPAHNDGPFDVGTKLHVRNFLDCVKSRQKPHCDARTGFQSTLPTLMAVMAVRQGRPVQWDGTTANPI